MGSALDLWTAYRERAYLSSPQPFLGYFFMLEDCPKSQSPVKVYEPHFKVFPEFVWASYCRRYELFCRTNQSIWLSLHPRTGTSSGTKEVAWLTLPCRIAPVALAFALLQIPIWSLMTRQFPPAHFSNAQAYIATAGVLFGLGGPMAPMLAGIGRRLWEINQGQRRKIKEKKERSPQRPEPYL